MPREGHLISSMLPKPVPRAAADEGYRPSGQRAKYSSADELLMAKFVVSREAMSKPGSEHFWRDAEKILPHSMSSLHSHWKRMTDREIEKAIAKARELIVRFFPGLT